LGYPETNQLHLRKLQVEDPLQQTLILLDTFLSLHSHGLGNVGLGLVGVGLVEVGLVEVGLVGVGLVGVGLVELCLVKFGQNLLK